jgi:hypothetical protein
MSVFRERELMSTLKRSALALAATTDRSKYGRAVAASWGFAFAGKVERLSLG